MLPSQLQSQQDQSCPFSCEPIEKQQRPTLVELHLVHHNLRSLGREWLIRFAGSEEISMDLVLLGPDCVGLTLKQCDLM